MFINGNIYNLSLLSPLEVKVVMVVNQRMKATKLSWGSSYSASARVLHAHFQNYVPSTKEELFHPALVRNSNSSSCIIPFIHRSHYTLKSRTTSLFLFCGYET